jgi:hypothetical protein
MLNTKLEEQGCWATKAPAAKGSWVGCSTKQGLFSRCMMHLMLSDSMRKPKKGTKLNTLDRHHEAV